MPDRFVSPARNLSGALRLAGDKSLSHRYAILAALADGPSRLENFSAGADCASTLACLSALGVPIVRDPESVAIAGVGLHGLTPPSAPLDAGNSGSTMRMLAGILAAQPFASTIAGDASLSRRPMRRVVEPLRRMGASIADHDGHAPLHFSPAAALHALDYDLPVPSAQVKTALLFAGLYAHGVTRVGEPIPTRDHTEIALRALGAPLTRAAGAIRLTGPVPRLAPLGTVGIPGDPSSAAFFLCAAALFDDAHLLVDGISLNPTRAALLDLLRGIGADLSVVSVSDAMGELAGSLRAGGRRADALGRRPARLAGARVAGPLAAALVDEIPVLAVLATATESGIEFADAAELRVKESDRIAAVAANLRAMGATCEERPDGLFVPGRQPLRGARVASFGDHRIAMAFAIAALIATGDTLIEDAGCVAISFPDFFDLLDRLAER